MYVCNKCCYLPEGYGKEATKDDPEPWTEFEKSQHECKEWQCVEAFANICQEHAQSGIDGFIDTISNLAHDCICDAHWLPQADRMEDKYWQYIDFVGHLMTITKDRQ